MTLKIIFILLFYILKKKKHLLPPYFILTAEIKNEIILFVIRIDISNFSRLSRLIQLLSNASIIFVFYEFVVTLELYCSAWIFRNFQDI